MYTTTLERIHKVASSVSMTTLLVTRSIVA
jgi:hypothetical protein